jgi:hypothetical protein
MKEERHFGCTVSSSRKGIWPRAAYEFIKAIAPHLSEEFLDPDHLEQWGTHKVIAARTKEIKGVVSRLSNEQQEIEPPVADSSPQQPAVLDDEREVSYFSSRNVLNDKLH